MSRKKRNPLFVFFLPMPIINEHGVGLMENIGSWILEERVVAAEELVDEAGDVEVVAVLSQLSMVAPLKEEYARIYVYLALKVLKEKGMEVNIPEHLRVLELSEHEKYLLRQLRREIRERQWRKLKYHHDPRA
ncbi:MAG: hypothetical protein QW212_00015 [Nitrososphaerales archaeon]